MSSPVIKTVDLEAALLTMVVGDGAMRLLLREKVTAEYFADPLNRQVFTYLLERYAKFTTTPSMELVQAQFPSFSPKYLPSEEEEDVLLLVDAVRERKIHVDLQNALSDVVDAAREDPRAGLVQLKKHASAMAIEYASGDVEDATKALEEVERQYSLNKHLKGMVGTPWPWAALNEVTHGRRKGQFIGIYGPPAVMKTYLLLYIAAESHQFYSQRPIIFTHEMTVAEMRERYALIRAKIHADRFDCGVLTEAEEKRLYETMAEMKGEDPFVIADIEAEGGTSALLEMEAKVREYGATEVYVDGLAHLLPRLAWEEFGNVTKGLKKMAKRLDVPIVATHHANREGGKRTKAESGQADDVALGEPLFRDVDVLLRLVRTGAHEEAEEILVAIKKVRRGKRNSSTGSTFIIHAKPAYDFSQKYSSGDEEFNGADDGDGLFGG